MDDGAWEVHEPAAPYGRDAEVDEGVPYSHNLGMNIGRKRKHSVNPPRDFTGHTSAGMLLSAAL
jgi:hypothetical protein